LKNKFIAIVMNFKYSKTINISIHELSLEILQQILECSNQYQINHCDPKERVPAMQKICSEWELCMNRRPDDVIMYYLY